MIKLLVAEQSGRDIKSVLYHEISAYAPAFTRNGVMHHGTKLDIVDLLMKGLEEGDPKNPPATSGVVVDGAVAAHMLSPARKMNISDYGDYVQHIQIPYVENWLRSNDRCDMVYDQYDDEKPSLKQAAWNKRGEGERKRVNLNAKIPKNWASFLRNNSNKNSFFQLLASEMALHHVSEV